jgi:NTP pyrophosphatase (non-canonical NTP hydrolase)
MREVDQDWFQDVLDFHLKFAPSYVAPNPSVPAKRGEEHYCLGFMEEELDETRRAMEAGDVAAVADGLADLVYVACRAAMIWGIDLREQWTEVHQANMAKEGGEIKGGKLRKPPGWQPPDNMLALTRQRPLK